MAFKLWIGGSSNAFGTAGNWSPSGVPANGDTVVIDGNATQMIAGSDQSAITLAALRIFRSCTFDVGSSATPLKIGATICEIGLTPDGGSSATGPQTVALDFSSIQTACTVYTNRGSGAGGYSSTIIRGTNASNKLTVKGGSVGVGTIFPGEATTFTEIDVAGSDTNVTIGYGVTLTTLNQSNGSIVLNCAATTINQDGGTLETRGSGAITTANISGQFVANGTGTITTLNVSASGSADFTNSPSARTVTNSNLYGATAFLLADNNAPLSVTFTNGVACKQGAKTKQVDFGDTVTVTPS